MVNFDISVLLAVTVGFMEIRFRVHTAFIQREAYHLYAYHLIGLSVTEASKLLQAQDKILKSFRR